jgi:molybdopterin-guanine dinucleotide biosynthesis protein B
MKAFGFVGDSGSGKTTLIEKLILHFAREGLRVAAIKHAHEGFDVDRPGKDSYRFREAGARQVLLASPRRWALLSEEDENRTIDAPGDLLRRLLNRLEDCDVVFVEGFRGTADIPYIEVKRNREDAAGGSRPIAAGVVAVATDDPALAEAPHLVVLDLDDPDAIARFIATKLELPQC